MNATLAFQRLLWKEVRVLRQLWVMCGIGVMFLMLIVLAIGESSEHSRGYSAAFWVFMVWVPPVYVLAAISTMFAGEREEGTLVWLTALAPRLPSVLSTRVLFVVITGIGLQLWYGLTALLLSQFDEPLVDTRTDMQENFIIMTFVLLEALAYGMFWSLQTNRPLNAILYSAITIIAVNTGAVMLTEALGGTFSVLWSSPMMYALGFWGWARCLIVFGVMIANYELAGRWLNGRPCDWEWLAHWWSKRRTGKVAVGTGVAVMPRDAAEPWGRAWQRLRWLEWQGIKSYLFVVLALTVVSCGSLLAVGSPSTMAFALILSWLAVLIAGLASWHGEQAQQRFRALVRLGVSPFALWVNKLGTWFLASVVGVICIVSITALWWKALYLYYGPERFPEWFGTYRPGVAAHVSTEMQAFGLCYFATIFTMGFASAHLIRKTVIAFGVSAIGTGLFTAWMVMCGEYGLPWFVFYAPIPVWLLWMSASALPAWWTENTSWRLQRSRLTQLASQGLFPIAVLMLAAGYRVWEVPSVAVVEPETHIAPMSPVPLANNAHAKRPEPPRTLIATLAMNPDQSPDAWGQLSALMRQDLEFPQTSDADTLTTPPDEKPLPPGIVTKTSAIQQSILETNRKTLTELRDRVLRLPVLHAHQILYQNSGDYFRARLLLSLAQQRLAAGDVEESLAFLQAGTRLAGILQRNRPLNPQQLIRDDAVLVEEIRAEMVRWAQHPQQSAATLSRGLQLCAFELRFWQTQPQELYLLRNEDQTLLNFQLSLYFWEIWRKQKLINIAYDNRLTYLQSCNAGWIRPGVAKRNTPDYAFTVMQVYGSPRAYPPHLAAWQFVPQEQHSEWTMPSFHFSDVYGLDVRTIELMHNRENEFRATLVTMALVGHRRIHGALPATLFEMDPVMFAQKAFKDVWSDDHFRYAPNGFGVSDPELPSESKFRQPLLWTGGPHHMQVTTPGIGIHRYADFGGRQMNYEVIRDNQSQRRDWLFPIPPQDPEAAPDAGE